MPTRIAEYQQCPRLLIESELPAFLFSLFLGNLLGSCLLENVRLSFRQKCDSGCKSSKKYFHRVHEKVNFLTNCNNSDSVCSFLGISELKLQLFFVPLQYANVDVCHTCLFLAVFFLSGASTYLGRDGDQGQVRHLDPILSQVSLWLCCHHLSGRLLQLARHEGGGERGG